MSDETALSNVEHTASSGTTRLTTDEVPFASELESFRLTPDGKLTRAPGSPFGFPVAPPEPPFMLGLATHPTKDIIPYAAAKAGLNAPRRGVIESREAMLELPYALRQ